jgi:hypothetical protein
MTAPAAVVRGAGAVWRAWRVWLLVWALTLAFAVLLVAPVAALLYARLDHSLYAARLFDNFELQWLAEFRNETGNWPALAAAPFVALVSGAYLLLTTFLTGGVLTVLAGRDAFWPGCARNFGRLARLLLLSLVWYAIVYVVFYELGTAGHWLWGRGMAERPVVIFNWLRAGVTALLFLFVNMVFDYAKIHLVAEDGRRAAPAARDSLRFVALHPAATIATYALVTALGAALVAAWWLLPGALPRSTLAWLVLVFGIQQAFVAGRIAVRLLYLAAQLEIWRRFAPTRSEVTPCV